MSETISKRFVGRLIGVLYLAASLLAGITTLLPLELSFKRSDMLLMLVPTLLAGIFGWFAPWHRWSPRASLGLVVYAAVLITGGVVILDINPSIGFPFYVLVFVWVGVGHSKYTSCFLFPMMGASLVSTHVLGRGLSPDQSMAGIVMLLIGVGVGELLAYIIGILKSVERREHDRLSDMGVIIDAIEELASQVSAEGVGSHVAWFSGELMGGLGSKVLLLDAELEITSRYEWGISSSDSSDSHRAGTCEVPVQIWEQLRDGDVVVTSPEHGGCWEDVEDVHSVLWAGLRGTDQPFGVVAIALAEAPDEVRSFRQAIGRVLAAQGGLAFERVESKLSLLDQSLKDELTGIGNRRRVMAMLARLSVGDGIMMIDLDHFKNVNDSFGHQVGDELLKDVANYLVTSLRDHDAVARFGGDEFVAVIHGVEEKAQEITLRLLDGWRALDPIVSLSIGVALHESGTTPHATLQKADTALYNAKERGRDQGVIFHGSQVPSRLVEPV